MSTTTARPNVLMIAGMHRSGTSLLASWLQQCGLYIGDELVPAGVGNPLGHFEDIKFLEFHDAVLQENDFPVLVTNQVIRVSEEQRRLALAITADRRDLPQWGWKDPRTCLFLPFWKEVIPDAKAIFIFRHPIDVINSFRRRALQRQAKTGEPLFATERGQLWQSLRLQIQLVINYLHSWSRHNQEILNFATNHPANSLIVQVEDLHTHSDQIVNHLVNGWGFDLKPVKFSEVYNPDLLQTQLNFFVRIAGLAVAAPTLMTYRQLLDYRSQTIQQIVNQPVDLSRPRLDLTV